MQQQALGQLQAGLIDELESKGTFQDPETQKIMEKYQKVPVICFSKGVRRWKKLKPKDWIRGTLGLIPKVIPKLLLDSHVRLTSCGREGGSRDTLIPFILSPDKHTGRHCQFHSWALFYKLKKIHTFFFCLIGYKKSWRQFERTERKTGKGMYQYPLMRSLRSAFIFENYAHRYHF